MKIRWNEKRWIGLALWIIPAAFARQFLFAILISPPLPVYGLPLRGYALGPSCSALLSVLEAFNSPLIVRWESLGDWFSEGKGQVLIVNKNNEIVGAIKREYSNVGFYTEHDAAFIVVDSNQREIIRLKKEYGRDFFSPAGKGKWKLTIDEHTTDLSASADPYDTIAALLVRPDIREKFMGAPKR